MSSRPIQYPVKQTQLKSGIMYTYACNGCGIEINGYTRPKVFGHVWCYGCYKKRLREKRCKNE